MQRSPLQPEPSFQSGPVQRGPRTRGLATFAVACLLAASTAQAQTSNFVSNGDFKNGTTGWTLSGFALDPKVMNFDTDGSSGSSDPAFSCLAGRQTFTMPVTYNLEQQVLVVPAVMEFTADFASIHANPNGANADGGRANILIGGNRIAVESMGRITGNNADLKRRKICVRFRPTSGGRQTLRIELYRNFNAALGVTPRVFLDNVTLRLASGPTVCMPGERKVTLANPLQILGPANCGFVALVAPKLSTTPIRIPNIGGALGLDLASVLILTTGVLDAQGRASQAVAAPSSLAGQALFWQAIGVCPTSNDFGNPIKLGFHR